MAKKNFSELLQQQRRTKTDGTATATEFLSQKTQGNYKETTIKIRISVKEKALWQQKAKEQYNKTLSAFIRENINYNIKRNITADDLKEE